MYRMICVVALSGACLLGACGDLDHLEESEQQEEVAQAPLQGFVTTRVPAGVMRIRHGGDIATGVLVGPDLVWMGRGALREGISPRQLQLEFGAPGRSTVTRQGRYVNRNAAYIPGQAVQLDAPITSLSSPLDERLAQQLEQEDVELTCYAFNASTRALRLNARIRDVGLSWPWAAAIAAMRLVPANLGVTAFEARDEGAVCFDLARGTVAAIVAQAEPNGTAIAYPIAALRTWFQGLEHLTTVRRGVHFAGRTGWATYAPDGSAMCLDLPYGNPYANSDVNQFPCHGGENQGFWLERVPSGGMRLMTNDGLCLVVDPSSSTGRITTARCAAGAPEQIWQLEYWGPSGRVRRLRAPRAAGCLGVAQGSSSTRRAAVAKPCAMTSDQAWSWDYVPWY